MNYGQNVSAGAASAASASKGHVTASFIKEVGIDVSRPDAPPAVIPSDSNILITIGENSGIWMGSRLIDPRAVAATSISSSRPVHLTLGPSPNGKSADRTTHTNFGYVVVAA